MSLRSAYKTNASKEENGIWFEDTGVINADKTVPGFLLARASRANPKFARETEKLGKKYRRQFENDLVTGDVAVRLNKELFLDTILLDWRNVQLDDDGKNLAFTRENAEMLFEELPDLYELLEQAARKASNFRDEEIEDDTGN